MNLNLLLYYIKKLLDPNIVLIAPDRIIGLNSFNSVISEIYFDIGNTLIVNRKDFDTITCYPIVVDMITVKGVLLDYPKADPIIVTQSELCPSELIYKKWKVLKEKYDILKLSNKEEILVENIRHNPEIERMLSNNAASGVYILKYFNKYYITIYKSLLSVNKADDLLMTIYDNVENHPDMFIVKFTIIKKKEKFNIDIYFGYRKI